MDITTLTQVSPNLINTKTIETPKAMPALESPLASAKNRQGERSFEHVIKDAIEGANEMHASAEEAIRRLASGEDVDLHGTMIAIEKAGIATRLTLQVRNKALEAYQEIMRMQV